MSDDSSEKAYIGLVSNPSSNYGTENITLVEDGLESTQKWTHIGVMCLLEILWEQYDKSKVTPLPRRIIFENAAKEMRKNGFSCTRYDVQKKYANLTGTFRRIKANRGVGSNGEKLTWPYYEIMKEICKKEVDCRMPLDKSAASGSMKRGRDFGTSAEQQLSLDDLYPPIKRNRNTFQNNLSTLSGGVAVSSSSDCSIFNNQWEEKRGALEDFKMQLLETLFKDVKQQRSEAEEDILIHLQMRDLRNRHLKDIVNEMSHLRTEVKRELSSLSESINDLISAVRNVGS